MSEQDSESIDRRDGWHEGVYVDSDDEHVAVEVLPSRSQRLGSFTLICLILNRAIGSGIFATPSKIIVATGNVGPAMIMWALGGLAALCGLYAWNELGSTILRTNRKSVPRSGGEKNYVIMF